MIFSIKISSFEDINNLLIFIESNYIINELRSVCVRYRRALLRCIWTNQDPVWGVTGSSSSLSPLSPIQCFHETCGVWD